MLSLVLFANGSVVAQAPSFTGANLPSPGFVREYYNGDPTGVTPGTAGINQIWTFNVTPTSGLQNESYVSPSASPDAAAFPNATVALEDNGTFNFYRLTATDYTWLGAAASGQSVVYDILLNELPTDYLGSTTDNYEVDYPDGSSESGSSTVIYDGYGTLILNGDTFPNMMRLHRSDGYTTYNAGGFPTGTYSTETFAWYQTGSAQQYLTIANSMYNGSPSGSTVQFNPNAMTGVNAVNKSIQKAWLSVGVNGTVEVNVVSAQTQSTRVVASNALGQCVYGDSHRLEEGLNRITLNTRGLAAGIYWVSIRSTDETPTVLKLFVRWQ